MKKIYDKRMARYYVSLPPHIAEWLKTQPGGRSAEVRRLVEGEMKKEEAADDTEN